MKFHFCMICLLRFIVLISEASRSQSFVTRPELSARQTKPFSVPTYNVSAGGFSSAARGWNSWGLQANPLTNYAGFVFNDYHFLQQCGLVVTTPGYDYYCSVDSGWSADQGDEYGRFVEDKSIFSTTGSLANFSDQIHGMGMKVGIYLLPGAFEVDAGTTIENTTLKIGDILDYETPSYFSRRAFNWSADGVQQWHDSVIKHLASLGVDMIKLDFITPGSPKAGEPIPADTSQSVVKYRRAIDKYGPGIRLHISYALDLTEPAWSIWASNADSLRLTTDVNNVNSAITVAWPSILRTIESYRLFITQHPSPIPLRPDLDNLYTTTLQRPSGLSNPQRYTAAIHYLCAGANLLSGSDQTLTDDLGHLLASDPEAMDVAAFTARWPMQPRNPGGGGNEARQLQAWIAGPGEGGVAVVVLVNYGAGGGEGGFGTGSGGVRFVSISFGDLGIGRGMVGGAAGWLVRRVWGGGGSGGADHVDEGVWRERAECWLGEGESVMYRFTRVGD